MDEKEKMLAGELYDGNYNKELEEERLKAKDLCFEYNNIKPSNKEEKKNLMRKILGNTKRIL